MTLLCIDDDPDDIEIFCEAMKQVDPSCVCAVANNGKHALDILRTLKPDMVFLDVNMPVMNGKDTLQGIRANEKLDSVPVCMLSTYINDDEAEVYRELGATECLIKPRSFSAFCQMLQRIFQKKIQTYR
jgi:CheY-like chemotaxis protein